VGVYNVPAKRKAIQQIDCCSNRNEGTAFLEKGEKAAFREAFSGLGILG
jgi:hypothetical protein